MTHEEFVEKVIEVGAFEEASEIRRISTADALMPASWIRRVLKVIPDADGYLKERCPDAWRQYKEAKERVEEANNKEQSK